MLPQDQIENIKQQLISQLETSNLPNAAEIKKSIIKMNPEQLEEFLIQNNLIKNESTEQDLPVSSQEAETRSEGRTPQCIFCSIINGDVPTYKIDENKDSIATLEIRPASKAHTIIIPKKHIESSATLPQSAFSLAKKISRKIKSKFKPTDIQISSANVFGHEIINVLPIYADESLNSERVQAPEEELLKLQKKLEKKSRPKQVKKIKTKKIKEQNLWLPKRIP